MSDGDKIRRQVELDLREFCRMVKTLYSHDEQRLGLEAATLVLSEVLSLLLPPPTSAT